MIGGIVVLSLALAALIVLTTIVFILGIMFFKKAREANRVAQEHVKEVEEFTQKEHNKIATLSPQDFHAFLTTLFAQMIERSAIANVNIKDPEAYELLLGYAQHRLIEYLGPETIAAIEYYYGKGYIDRYCQNSFMLLATRRELSSIISENTKFEQIEKVITAAPKL